MSITYIPLPQPEELTSREKEDSIGAYLIMFAAFAVSIPLPIVNSIAAIIYFYINRKKSPTKPEKCEWILFGPGKPKSNNGATS